MKYYVLFITILSFFTMNSCRDKGLTSESSTRPEPYHHSYLVSGLIVASFHDSIEFARAESFVRGFGLTPMDFTDYETDPLRSGTIGVPIGLERFWVGSLSKYPSFVRSTSRLGVMEEA